MEFVARYFLYYLIYSVLGYICEVIYVGICTKKIADRGYLYGPLCPIYGFGALIILLSLEWAYDYWWVVLILGILLTSTLEYLTSFFMEIIFHMRWWDYSDKFLNINGRVCLRNSLMFGALVMVVIYLIHPYLVTKLVGLITIPWVLYLVFGILLTVHIVDFIFSTIKHVSIRNIICKLEEYYAKAKEELSNVKDLAEAKVSNVKDLASNKVSTYKANLEEYFNGVSKKLEKFSIHYPSLKIKSSSKKRLSYSELKAKIKDRFVK